MKCLLTDMVILAALFWALLEEHPMATMGDSKSSKVKKGKGNKINVDDLPKDDD